MSDDITQEGLQGSVLVLKIIMLEENADKATNGQSFIFKGLIVVFSQLQVYR